MMLYTFTPYKLCLLEFLREIIEGSDVIHRGRTDGFNVYLQLLYIFYKSIQ